MNISYITNENDVFFYFEMIRQVEPESVLDIDVFLKRMGTLSRQTRDGFIPDHVRLTGVEPEGYPKIGIYNTVYDEILRPDKLIDREDKYNLAFFLGDPMVDGAEEMAKLWTWISKHVDYAAMDEEFKSMIDKKGWIRNLKIKNIRVEKDSYYLAVVAAENDRKPD